MTYSSANGDDTEVTQKKENTENTTRLSQTEESEIDSAELWTTGCDLRLTSYPVIRNNYNYVDNLHLVSRNQEDIFK
ncbi:hypothetical protein WA026_013171 [Henosepilachna vigintioctopunctata]|uniref:Uncharacterized protein n=1 Tax=Henosepilachna vigintioctopunctata TaxID=420089 RepID=A0AAW1UN41_9CUCU